MTTRSDTIVSARLKVLRVATGITRGNFYDTRYQFELGVETPKTATSKNGGLGPSHILSIAHINE